MTVQLWTGLVINHRLENPKRNTFCEICLDAGQQYVLKTKTKGWMGFCL